MNPTVPSDCSTPVEVVSIAAPRSPLREFAHYAGITQVRRSTSARLVGAELPSCFIDATVQAGINSLTRNTVSARTSRRRAVDKAVRVLEAE